MLFVLCVAKSKGKEPNQLGALISIALWQSINIYPLNEVITTKLHPYYIRHVKLYSLGNLLFRKPDLADE